MSDENTRKQLDELRGQLTAVEMLLNMVAPRIEDADGNPISQEMIDDLLEPLQSRRDASEEFKDGFKFGMERVLLNRPRARSRLQSSLSISFEFPQD